MNKWIFYLFFCLSFQTASALDIPAGLDDLLIKPWNPTVKMMPNGIFQIYLNENKITYPMYSAVSGAVCGSVYLELGNLEGVKQVHVLNKVGAQGFVFNGGKDACNEIGKLVDSEADERRGELTFVYGKHPRLEKNDVSTDKHDVTNTGQEATVEGNVVEESQPKTSYRIYIESGDSFNDIGDIEQAHENYLKAYEVAKTKEQKKIVLGSLAVTAINLRKKMEGVLYLQKLLALFPDNKWAKGFSLQHDLGLATIIYSDLMLLVNSSSNTIKEYHSYLKKWNFIERQKAGLHIFQKDILLEDSLSPDDVILLFFDKKSQLSAIFSLTEALPTDVFARESSNLLYGQLVFLTRERTSNEVVELFVKDFFSEAE